MPGSYNVSFHLRWPAGSTSELVVYRTVVVEEACAEGERTCDNGKCSVDGACKSSLGAGTSAAAANSAPVLTLNVDDVVGSRVEVPYGVAYLRCTEGQAPTKAVPCEPLGSAFDAEVREGGGAGVHCGCLRLY